MSRDGLSNRACLAQKVACPALPFLFLSGVFPGGSLSLLLLISLRLFPLRERRLAIVITPCGLRSDSLRIGHMGPPSLLNLSLWARSVRGKESAETSQSPDSSTLCSSQKNRPPHSERKGHDDSSEQQSVLSLLSGTL